MSRWRLRLDLVALFLTFDLAVLNVWGWLVTAIRDPRGSDFAAYYAVATVALQHGWDHLYDPILQRREFDALGGMHWYPNAQTPVLAWLVAPFTLLPLPVAYALWSALMVGSLLLAWWLLAPGRALQRAALLTAAVALLPMTTTLYEGQAALFVMGGVAVAWWLLSSSRDFAAGLVLALVIAIKPQECVLVPLALLAAGRWRVFLAWASASAVLGLAAVASIGASGTTAYLQRVLTASHDPAPWLVLTSVTIPGLIGPGVLAWVAQGGAAATALIAARRHRDEIEIPMAAGLVGSLLLSPFLHLPDLVLLLPAAWLFLRAPVPAWQRWSLLPGYVLLELVQAGAGWALVLFEAAWVMVMALTRAEVSRGGSPATVSAVEPARSAAEA